MSLHLDMTSLLSTAPEARDEEWEKAFFLMFPQSNLRILDEGPQQGPDGFPYLYVSIDPDAPEPVPKVIEWLSTKGIGMAVNPALQTPDYVFTYGQIWNFKETGQFVTETDQAPTGQFKIEAGQKVHTGDASKEYLPGYVRDLMRGFFNELGKPKVKILMLSQDGVHYDLCFSIESLQNPEKHEHRGILEALSWFLPGHYSIALISEKDLPSFFDL